MKRGVKICIDCWREQMVSLYTCPSQNMVTCAHEPKMSQSMLRRDPAFQDIWQEIQIIRSQKPACDCYLCGVRPGTRRVK